MTIIMMSKFTQSLRPSYEYAMMSHRDCVDIDLLLKNTYVLMVINKLNFEILTVSGVATPGLTRT